MTLINAPFMKYLKILLIAGIAGISTQSLSAATFEELMEQKATRMNDIGHDEGKRRLEKFQKFRYNGGYSLKFDLIDMPRRGRGPTFSGTLLGDWNSDGPMMRIEFKNGHSPGDKPLKLLVHSGFNPKIWMQENGGKVRELSYEEWFQPIFDGSDYTPFDFSLNFIFWDYFEYKGPMRVKGRPSAQKFLMKMPKALARSNPQIGGAYLSMDDTYNVILGAELLDKQMKKMRSYKLLNFQEVNGEYIIKGIDVVDEKTHNKTRFKVVAAAMGLDVRPEVFEPKGLVTMDATVESKRFQYINH